MQNNPNPWDVYFCTYMGNPNLRGFWKILIFDDFAAIQHRLFFFSIYGRCLSWDRARVHAEYGKFYKLVVKGWERKHEQTSKKITVLEKKK